MEESIAGIIKIFVRTVKKQFYQWGIMNTWAILVAAVVGFIIGGAWYTIFGKQWMRLTGVTKKQIEKAKKQSMVGSYVGAFIMTLVMSVVLAVLVSLTGVPTWCWGAGLGALVWLGFVATVMANSVFWENKSWPLWLLNTGHYLAVLLVMGAILGAWQ
jgi:hypothetical protein